MTTTNALLGPCKYIFFHCGLHVWSDVFFSKLSIRSLLFLMELKLITIRHWITALLTIYVILVCSVHPMDSSSSTLLLSLLLTNSVILDIKSILLEYHLTSTNHSPSSRNFVPVYVHYSINRNLFQKFSQKPLTCLICFHGLTFTNKFCETILFNLILCLNRPHRMNSWQCAYWSISIPHSPVGNDRN